MRIDAYNQISQVYQTNQKTKTQSVSKASPKDAVYISSTGKDYQNAKMAVASVSDIREDKVEEIKARMDAGTYQVGADAFAERLIAKYEENMR